MEKTVLLLPQPNDRSAVHGGSVTDEVGRQHGIGQILVIVQGARVHAPNENLRISDLLLGAKHTAVYLLALAANP